MSQTTPICFTIKILLAFSVKTSEKTKAKTKPEKPNSKKKAQPEITDPPYLIRLEKTCSVAHIEYEILPGKCKLYQIDVLCWKNAAKIYTPDSTKIFKPVSRNGLTFVPICIEHYLKELTINDLCALRNAVIEFNVYTDKNNLGNMATLNKTEIIYINETDIDRIDFVDGFTEKVNKSEIMGKSVRSKSTDTNTTRNTASQKPDNYSQMKFPEKFADELYEIIDYIFDISIPRDQIIFRDFVRSCEPPSDVKSQKPPKRDSIKTRQSEKSSKKEKTSKSKSAKEKTGKLTLQMQGEIFFTDDHAIFKLENDKSEVNKMFVLPNVSNLLTRFQKIELNPIVIKVISIKHFPAELFENSGFTDVYCKYSIPCIAECKTIEKPISRTIRFMESHIFSTRTLSKIKLLEFLETKRFIVELYGIQTYQNVDTEPKMFGEKSGDKNISKIQNGFRKSCLEEADSSQTDNVLLAYSTFDLSSLLKNVWDFRANEQLHIAETRILSGSSSPPNDPAENPHLCQFYGHYDITVNRINLAGISFNTIKTTSPLKEWILIENNSVLNIEAYLLSPQSASLVLHQIPNTYKRLLIIAFTKEVAQRCFGNIFSHNQRIMCGELKNEDILTGFVIDNGNNFVIYVEGYSVGYILNLWQDCDNITPQEAKIFFNTDQTYEHRLYGVCNKWIGFFLINMRIPLEYIFKNKKVYVKGNMPLLCQKVLIKLNLMFLSSTMKKMFQDDLFPTIEELVSLDLEYGVPYFRKSCTESISNFMLSEDNIKAD